MSGPSQTRQRREIHFSGRVQGVGFRYTARQIAERFDVTGFVQNLADGRVKLVVEGAPATVQNFVTALADEMERYISDQNERVSAATDEFTRFEVRH